MDGDSEMLNALARNYETNLLLHVGGKGGDLNFNPRQKKHIRRQLQALLGFDPSKLVWWVQCQVNGWNCGVKVSVCVDVGRHVAHPCWSPPAPAS